MYKKMSISTKIIFTTLLLSIVLLLSGIVAISSGSSGTHFMETLSILTGNSDPDSVTATIIWQIRLPRVILAAFVGGTLALGGLVFQALLVHKEIGEIKETKVSSSQSLVAPTQVKILMHSQSTIHAQLKEML